MPSTLSVWEPEEHKPGYQGETKLGTQLYMFVAGGGGRNRENLKNKQGKGHVTTAGHRCQPPSDHVSQIH